MLLLLWLSCLAVENTVISHVVWWPVDWYLPSTPILQSFLGRRQLEARDGLELLADSAWPCCCLGGIARPLVDRSGHAGAKAQAVPAMWAC